MENGCINDALPAETVTAIIEMLRDEDVPVMVFPCALVCRQWRDIIAHAVAKTRDEWWCGIRVDSLLKWRELSVNMAAYAGYLHLLRWLVDDVGVPLGNGTRRECECAIGTACAACTWVRGGDGEFRMLAELRWTGDTIYRVAASGRMDVLDYLAAKGMPWDESVCNGLAWYGDIELLARAREAGCPWDHIAYVDAIKAGNWNVLEYAYANGCPFDDGEWLTRAAAKRADIGMLRWLRERGCAWNWRVYRCAIVRRSWEILEYARAGGCPMGSCEWLVYTAAACGDLAMLEWLRACGCAWDHMVYIGAIESDCRCVLDYARDGGCPGDEHAVMTELIKRGCAVLLERALDRAIVSTECAVKYTMRSGDLHLLDYLGQRVELDYNMLCICALLYGDYMRKRRIIDYAFASGRVVFTNTEASADGKRTPRYRLSELLDNGFVVTAGALSEVKFGGRRCLLRMMRACGYDV